MIMGIEVITEGKYSHYFYNATATTAIAAPPRANTGALVICKTPPVLVDEDIVPVAEPDVCDVCDAVVSEDSDV